MKPTKLLILNIKLKEVSNPEVWRKIIVPANITFDDLHYAIQLAMGWADTHLYEFVDDCEKYDANEFRYAIPSEYDAEMDYKKNMDSRRRKLSGFFKKVGDKLDYVYDFGDHWCHDVVLEGTLKDEPWAYCQDGEGLCPPDDVGGAGGYAMMKQLFEDDPDSDEAKEYLTWMGTTSFDPNYFNRRQANASLGIWFRFAHPEVFYEF